MRAHRRAACERTGTPVTHTPPSDTQPDDAVGTCSLTPPRSRREARGAGHDFAGITEYSASHKITAEV
eukprot:CAMPEP_0206045908 /NCGR_PEP_ID=MMETSP1466-20131121/17195_1 /ASSEMBLY_ACC=CAM_ASM_001126 /TAXON_ID=44452 /ORGANISM="Pavlova gyrans, Strain CCMP608" /LENGTH=67 /DNA_ID=CAMNT_0053420863 /DNA_START=39 /DNA_END=239 /DNA_ORIENTATION=+